MDLLHGAVEPILELQKTVRKLRENNIRELKDLREYIKTHMEYNQTSSDILQEIDRRIKKG